MPLRDRIASSLKFEKNHETKRHQIHPWYIAKQPTPIVLIRYSQPLSKRFRAGNEEYNKNTQEKQWNNNRTISRVSNSLPSLNKIPASLPHTPPPTYISSLTLSPINSCTPHATTARYASLQGFSSPTFDPVHRTSCTSSHMS